jgi:hypothetical protein
VYLATEREWVRCAERISTESAIGLDSEFTGVDFGQGQSCVNRAKIHVWSIGILTNQLHPRGYKTAVGCVLPAIAIPTFRGILENPSIVKAIHNAPVDVHAFYNAGVDVVGVVNTLSLGRWALPGRQRYNLDDVCTDCLGAGKADSFDSLFKRTKYIDVTKTKNIEHRRCLTCGEPGVEANGFIGVECRRRKYPHIQTRWTVEESVTTQRKDGSYYYDQSLVISGHELWERYVEYALVDAVRAIEFYDFCNRVDKKTEVIWYKS